MARVWMPQVIDEAEAHHDVKGAEIVLVDVVNACADVPDPVLDLEQPRRVVKIGAVRVVGPQRHELASAAPKALETKKAVPRRNLQHAKSVHSRRRLEDLQVFYHVLYAGRRVPREDFPFLIQTYAFIKLVYAKVWWRNSSHLAPRTYNTLI